MKKTISKFLIALSSMLFLYGCSKEVPDHTHEVYGNAQIETKSFTVFSWEWNFLDPDYYVDLSVPEVTQSVVENGAVMVYYENNYGEWQAMPNVIPITSNYSTVYSFSHWPGFVSLYAVDTDLLTSPPGDMNIKIVIIGERQMLQDDSIDWTNYEEVITKLNLNAK